MSLDDIKKNLYKNEKDPVSFQHGSSEFSPENAPLILNNQPAEPDEWKEKKGGLGHEGRKAMKIGALVLGLVLLLAGIAVGAYWYRSSSFSQERATVAITGSKEVLSGKLLTYEINYKNDNRADLKNVKLKITYPDSFKPEENPNFKIDSPVSGIYDLADIKGHTEGKVLLNGRVYTPKGAFIYIKGELSYSPSGFSIQYVSKSELGIKVISTPLELEITAPQNVSSGDEVNYLINYKNSGEQSFDSVKIKADFPDGFSYSNSDPKPFESNNIWYIGQVAAGQAGKIIISGKLDGERDQVKPIKVYIGSTENGEFISYSEEDASSKIVTSPLVIAQTVNGLASLNANAGDTLNFEINYKNAGDIGMRDVIVTENIDSQVLDYSSLAKKGGSFDEGSKTITWKSQDYKELKTLEPGQGGQIKFSIKVKSIIPISGANDKNYVISSISKIDSPDVPTPIHMNKVISGNKMDIKLNSKLILDVSGYYNDAGIPNSGPVPPKVGQETTYTIHWKMTNISNDLSGAKIESALPTGTVFTGKVSPEDVKIEYNERANSLLWNIGNIVAGAGIISPVKEISFQVKIKPSIDQAGKEAEILKESKVTAKDNFTGQDLASTAAVKTTNLPEDAGLKEMYKVAN
jgi:uncharacterized repeat protein (TIGR01451 family)